MNHRVKNLFAVIQSVIRMSVRQSPEARAFADRLGARLDALAAAHLTGLDSEGVEPVAIDALFAAVLRPFFGDRGDSIQCDGPDIAVPRRMVTPLSLTLHELAMNAFKHGALARSGGKLQVDWRRVDEGGAEASLVVRWHEDCGEPISPPQDGSPKGFGKTLIAASVSQMSESCETEWNETGMHATLILPLEIDA